MLGQLREEPVFLDSWRNKNLGKTCPQLGVKAEERKAPPSLWVGALSQGDGNWSCPPVFCTSRDKVYGLDLLKDMRITQSDHQRYHEALMPTGPLDCCVCMVLGHRAQAGLPSSGQDDVLVTSCSPAVSDVKFWAPDPSSRAQSRAQGRSQRMSAKLLAVVQPW